MRTNTRRMNGSVIWVVADFQRTTTRVTRWTKLCGHRYGGNDGHITCESVEIRLRCAQLFFEPASRTSLNISGKHPITAGTSTEPVSEQQRNARTYLADIAIGLVDGGD